MAHRGAQTELAEVVNRVDAIEEAAAAYVKIRDKRMTLTTQEVEARGVLIAAMKEAKVETYRTLDDLVCVLETKDKVKVKASDGEEESEG